MSDQHGSGTPDPAGSAGSSAWSGSHEAPTGHGPLDPSPSESRPAGYGGSTYPESAAGTPDPAGQGVPSYSPPATEGPSYGQAMGPGQGTYPPGAYPGTYPNAPYGAASPYGTGAGAPLSKGVAIAALVFGVIAFLLGLLPFVASVFAVVAVILGIVALRKVAKGTGAGRGLAIAGIVLGTLALLFNILWSVFIGGMMAEFADCASQPTQAQQEQCVMQKLEERGIDTSGVEGASTSRT